MFNRFNLVLYLFFCVCVMMAHSPSVDRKPRLLWSDEFDYEGLPDSTRWTYDVGDGCPNLCGWGNSELQYYTRAVKKNARVENGRLIIEAHKEKAGGSEYTSARLKSANAGSWTYGYIEVKAKLPEGRGTWPAIWMLPDSFKYGGWPSSGEIDIMEHVGFDQGTVHGTVHTGKYNHLKNTQVGSNTKVTNCNEDFHVYAINWTTDKIEFLVDGKQYHAFRNNGEGFEAWPFDHPFHLILNIAVGGGWGGREGVDESIWPQRMEIDYVRVYRSR